MLGNNCIFFTGVRGTTVAIARLNRENEKHFKPMVTIEKINSLNNFKFSEDEKVIVHRQYEIGPGKVKSFICINEYKYLITSFRFTVWSISRTCQQICK